VDLRLHSNSIDLAADILGVDLRLQANPVELAADILSVDLRLQSNSIDLAAEILSVDMRLQSNSVDLTADVLTAAVNEVTVQDISIIIFRTNTFLHSYSDIYKCCRRRKNYCYSIY
jgi:hypothetical protein